MAASRGLAAAGADSAAHARRTALGALSRLERMQIDSHYFFTSATRCDTRRNIPSTDGLRVSSRSGGNTPPGYEGGQMPLKRRVPKRGFRRLQKAEDRREEFVVVNLKRLAALGVETIDPALMAERGIIRAADKVKVLGDGALAGRITIRAHAFSSSAKEKIAAAGGVAELIEANPKLNA